MEKTLFQCTFNDIKNHDLLSKSRSDFQLGDFSVNQLVEIYDNIMSNLDNGGDIRFIFCDILNAFDRVWQMRLTFKLKNVGFGVNPGVDRWLSFR